MDMNGRRSCGDVGIVGIEAVLAHRSSKDYNHNGAYRALDPVAASSAAFRENGVTGSAQALAVAATAVIHSLTSNHGVDRSELSRVHIVIAKPVRTAEVIRVVRSAVVKYLVGERSCCDIELHITAGSTCCDAYTSLINALYCCDACEDENSFVVVITLDTLEVDRLCEQGHLCEGFAVGVLIGRNGPVSMDLRSRVSVLFNSAQDCDCIDSADRESQSLGECFLSYEKKQRKSGRLHDQVTDISSDCSLLVCSSTSGTAMRTYQDEKIVGGSTEEDNIYKACVSGLFIWLGLLICRHISTQNRRIMLYSHNLEQSTASLVEVKFSNTDVLTGKVTLVEKMKSSIQASSDFEKIIALMGLASAFEPQMIPSAVSSCLVDPCSYESRTTTCGCDGQQHGCQHADTDSESNDYSLEHPVNADNVRDPKNLRTEEKISATGGYNIHVVVTGIAATAPFISDNGEVVTGTDTIQRIIRGENFISAVPEAAKHALVSKNIVEIKKLQDPSTGATTVRKQQVSRIEDAIQLRAALPTSSNPKMGCPLTWEYGVSESIASTMDKAVQLAVAMGLEALKNAGIVRGNTTGCCGVSNHVRRDSSQDDQGVTPRTTDSTGEWVLPAAMQQSTGIVYATSFPALDTAIGEVTKYYSRVIDHMRNQANHHQNDGENQQYGQHVRLLSEHIKALLSKKLEEFSSDPLSHQLIDALNGIVVEMDDIAAAIVAQQSSSPFRKEDTSVEMPKPYEFDRKFLFRVLVLANAQLAQIIKAKGPNFQTNTACAGTLLHFSLYCFISDLEFELG
jgi:hypothetical protein